MKITKKKTTRFIKDNLTNILLIAILIILGWLLFGNKIVKYFKVRATTREVLKRVGIYNIPSVAEACFYYNQDIENGVETHIDTYQNCEDQVDKYWLDTERWIDLIKESRDLDCGDFKDGKDARNFYHYVSGELVKGYEGRQNSNSQPIVTLNFNSLFDGKCYYDPYGLDTNRNCNACEKF